MQKSRPKKHTNPLGVEELVCAREAKSSGAAACRVLGKVQAEDITTVPCDAEGWRSARSFAIGARACVFAVPFLQLIFTPALEVAGTGALMSLIGARFAMAALAARHRKGRPRPPGRPPGGSGNPRLPPGRRGHRIAAPPPGPRRPNSAARHPDQRGHVGQRGEIQPRTRRRVRAAGSAGTPAPRAGRDPARWAAQWPAGPAAGPW